MSHYFSENNNTLKSNPKEIAFRVNGDHFICTTDHGVFSKDGLDRGTEILLKYLEILPEYKTALDLGCGYGVVGLYLNKSHNITVDMVDINERAIELAKSNISRNHAKGNVYKSDGFSSVNGTFDLIVTNPPIRTGKKLIYQFFSEAQNYLSDNGALALVINKKHGAESAIKYLESIYETVEIVGKQKGFNVILCKK
jgi:16S rRNA (guanine1207-N2)-methyltransferase